MIKKSLVFLSLSLSLFAVDAVVMPDGKVAVLNKDGSWQEVTLAKMGDKTIALKKDGTWVVVDKIVKTIKPKVKSELLEISNESKSVQDTPKKLSSFAKHIVGHWKGDNEEFIFTDDYKMTMIKNGDKIEDVYTIVKYDEKKKTIDIGVGRRFKMGPFSMGGKIIKFRFSDDFNTLYDLNELEENYKEAELKRVR